ncbi:uncharacterized protein METZ01_LOCUS438459 [marine metagenome]|uniref:Uncharacterized protein n=1 Tax=marine metagenome TaxID=408172 RepID=A0A382YRW2_9ZZZZ
MLAFLSIFKIIFHTRPDQKEQALNSWFMRPAGGGVSSNPPPET